MPSDESGRNPETRSSRPPRWMVGALLGVVVAVEVADNIADGWNTASRAASSWWRHVERSERRRMHEAELDFVLRRLPYR